MLPQGRLLFALFCEFSTLLYRVVGHLCIRMAGVNKYPRNVNESNKPFSWWERASLHIGKRLFLSRNSSFYASENDGFQDRKRWFLS